MHFRSPDLLAQFLYLPIFHIKYFMNKLFSILLLLFVVVENKLFLFYVLFVALQICRHFLW